jgi:hypothetical protein
MQPYSRRTRGKFVFIVLIELKISTFAIVKQRSNFLKRKEYESKANIRIINSNTLYYERSNV